MARPIPRLPPVTSTLRPAIGCPPRFSGAPGLLPDASRRDLIDYPWVHRIRRRLSWTCAARPGPPSPESPSCSRSTSAPESLADEQARRIRRYLVTMGIRDGVLHRRLSSRPPLGAPLVVWGTSLPSPWSCPYVAVVLANAVRPREQGSSAPVTPRGDGPDQIERGDLGELVCSAKACRNGPRPGRTCWNNPTAAHPDRRKVWLACDDHRTVARRVPVRSAASSSRPCPRRDSCRRTAEPPRSRLRRRGGWLAADGGHRPVRLHEVGVADAVAAALAPHLALDQRRRARRRWRPSRSGPRRSVSLRENRQLRTWPSAVSRVRSQAAQNGARDAGDDADRSRARRRRGTARPARCRGRAAGSGVSVNRSASRVADLVGGDHRRARPSRAGRRAASAR